MWRLELLFAVHLGLRARARRLHVAMLRPGMGLWRWRRASVLGKGGIKL